MNLLGKKRYMYTVYVTAGLTQIMVQLKPALECMAAQLWKSGQPMDLNPRVLLCTVKMTTEKPLPPESMNAFCNTMLMDANRKYPGADIKVDMVCVEGEG